jgi:hypothetical protein
MPTVDEAPAEETTAIVKVTGRKSVPKKKST